MMSGNDGMIRRARPWLGTIVEVVVPEDQGEAVEAAFAQIRHVHQHMSYHEAGSDLDRIRHAAIGTLVRVDRETVNVLRIAQGLNIESNGLFDVTVGRRLAEYKFLPVRGPFDLAQNGGMAADIEIVDDMHIRCHAPMLIDLGGIAKGHGVDLAVNALIDSGCRCGIVNAGGDLRIFGDAPQSVWLKCADGRLAEPIEISNMAVATSSNRHMRRRSAGKVVTPHIGSMGKPIIADHAVTVIAPLCIIADALTKIALADHASAARLSARYDARILSPESLKIAA